MSCIIAVAAPVGGGKTSYVREIANTLKNASIISYDHYENLTEKPVESIMEWLRNGGDFNDFEFRNLAEDLKKLKNNETVTDPVTRSQIFPEKYIIFEMPLGKAHSKTAVYIDLLIWIDLPPDVALARKIKEFTESFLIKDGDYRNSILWLDNYLANYLYITREVLKIQREKVSPEADIIIDGEKDFKEMIQYCVKEIRKKEV